MRRLYHDGFDVSAGLKQSGSAFSYVPFPEPFEAEVLVVAGGGGGGRAGGVPGPTAAGGGGAGGVYSGSLSFGTDNFVITIGDGGSYPDTLDRQGGPGGDTIISGSGLYLLTLGGGGGGASGALGGETGADGGSGGGAGWEGTGTTLGGDGLQPLSGSGHLGNNGGNSTANGGGGGGGATGGGQLYDGATNLGGGGAGLISTIDGTSIQYARGGGGNNSGDSRLNTPGSGGVGNGSSEGTGRSGIVIIRYKSPFLRARGGTTAYRDGDYFIHKFTTDGILYV